MLTRRGLLGVALALAVGRKLLPAGFWASGAAAAVEPVEVDDLFLVEIDETTDIVEKAYRCIRVFGTDQFGCHVSETIPIEEVDPGIFKCQGSMQFCGVERICEYEVDFPPDASG